jgi:uncharacterized protein (TIGR04562 family)
MDRPEYLSDYLFDWELFNVIIGGKSALDSHSFLSPMYSREQVEDFLVGYGFSSQDTILKAELFGYFQESLEFIRRYFLKEGSEEGLPLTIPTGIQTISDVSDLFLTATGSVKDASYEECLWAGLVLKVMHTILHADKDLRSGYFEIIQQQIFDRFYKYIRRNKDNQLYLGLKGEEGIPLADFQTKSKKKRDSIIIKMLHKPENVAEELFDRVGLRFVTYNQIDTLRVVKFLQEKHVIIAHNIKPSRSKNTLVELERFKKIHHQKVKDAIREGYSRERFEKELEKAMADARPGLDENDNRHSSQVYRSIHFTCRQLIFYRNPMINTLSKLKKMAKKDMQENSENELAHQVSQLDLSLVSRDVRFFYPFEVQIVDLESHRENTMGEASHQDYKKSQQRSAMNRVFCDLIKYKNLKL